METSGRSTPTYNDASGSAAHTVDHASTGAHDTINKMADAAGPTVDRIASGAHEAVDKIAGAATQAAETLEVKGEQLKDLEMRLMENCRVYVREHPIKSLGIAIAGGFLLSRLLSAR